MTNVASAIENIAAIIALSFLENIAAGSRSLLTDWGNNNLTCRR